MCTWLQLLQVGETGEELAIGDDHIHQVWQETSGVCKNAIMS